MPAEPSSDRANSTPKRSLPRGRQPASYDDAALRSYLQKQWDDAGRRVPTYAELQRGDPDKPDVPRFGGSLTRLVRLRRAFLAQVDPTSAAASQHRLSRVENAVEKNTDRTDHAIELIESTHLGAAVRDLVDLANSLREQINTRDQRAQKLSEEIDGLRNELQSMNRAFKEWTRRSDAPTQGAGAAFKAAPTDGAGGAVDLSGLKELLTALRDDQRELTTLVGSVVDTQTSMGQAIGEVKRIASDRHNALDVVTERLEEAADQMRSAREDGTAEASLQPIEEMATRLEAAAEECLGAGRSTVAAAAQAGAEAGKAVLEAHAAAGEASRMQLQASIDGRLQSLEAAFADALASGSAAHDQAATVAREVAAQACVELATAASALRDGSRLSDRISIIEKGVGTLLGRRPPRNVRMHDESLAAIEGLVERRCTRIVKRIAAMSRTAADSGRSRKKPPMAKDKPRKATKRRRVQVTARDRKAGARRR